MRLTKREVERLLDAYDEDPVGALTGALRVARDRPDAAWSELVCDLPDGTALAAGSLEACDRLVQRLNERRTI